MIQSRVTWVGASVILLAIAGCAERPTPTSPDLSSGQTTTLVASSDIGAAQTSSGGGGGGGGAKETLTGPAINGVVPGGEALADMSTFSVGGSTTLTVRIGSVNLPDGAVVQVTFDFKPIGTIALSRGAGTLAADLGHFAVSFDQVRVNYGGGTILSGGSFR
jgi:hypothetical protein